MPWGEGSGRRSRVHLVLLAEEVASDGRQRGRGDARDRLGFVGLEHLRDEADGLAHALAWDHLAVGTEDRTHRSTTTFARAPGSTRQYTPGVFGSAASRRPATS